MQLTARTFVCWCCSRDYDLIPVHYAAIRKLTNEAVMYIYDGNEKDKDGKPVAPPKVPNGAATVPSMFERHGNLNGKAVVKGMVEFYNELGNMGVERIVKVDSDTVLTTLDWVDNRYNVGFHGSNGYYWTGCAYSLTMNTLRLIKDYLDRIDIEPAKGYTLPEDQVLTQIAALVQAEPVVLIENGKYVCTGFMPAMRSKPEVVKGIHGVCHCGQYQRLDPLVGCGIGRTPLVKSDMRYVLKHVYGKDREGPIKSDVPEHSFISAKKKAGD